MMVDACEIKVTLRPDEELKGLRALELDEDTAEVRLLYFYDTPKLDLFKATIDLGWRLRVVWHVREHPRAGAEPVQRPALEGHAPRDQGHQAGRRLEERTLAGTVRPDQRHHVAGRQRQRDLVQDGRMPRST
jgi:hypothetical protein